MKEDESLHAVDDHIDINIASEVNELLTELIRNLTPEEYTRLSNNVPKLDSWRSEMIAVKTKEINAVISKFSNWDLDIMYQLLDEKRKAD